MGRRREQQRQRLQQRESATDAHTESKGTLRTKATEQRAPHFFRPPSTMQAQTYQNQQPARNGSIPNPCTPHELFQICSEFDLGRFDL
jgi:hypothetical protein